MARNKPIALLLALALAGALLASSAADGRSTTSSSLVVSQVYAGGGNSGASYTNDFVELHNSGAPQSLAGWSVQYASAGGATWQVTPLPSGASEDWSAARFSLLARRGYLSQRLGI